MFRTHATASPRFVSPPLVRASRRQIPPLLMQVHDELVLEVELRALEEIKTGLVARMQGAATLDVPLLAEAGHGANWGQAH